MSKKEIIHPNHYACEGCDDWDSVNGCWRDYTRWCGKDPYEERDKERKEPRLKT